MSDSQSIDAIVGALYETISGPAGVARDWRRFRSLLLPGARLVRATPGPDGLPRPVAMDARAYEDDTAGIFRREPFFETGVAARVDRFGSIAHVLSVYEARRSPSDADPFRRGINSIQLCFDGRRWWVVSVLWDSEREDNPIPVEYLR